MKIDKNTVFFFSNGDRYGLHDNDITDILKDDFSIYCRFKPDMGIIDKIVEEKGVYDGALFAKNGKHLGLFFNVYGGPDGEICKKISWKFWSHDVETGNDVEKALAFSFYTSENDGLYDNSVLPIIEDRYYNIIINHNLRKKEYTITETVSDKSKSIIYDNMIDYSDSYAWIGAATLISDIYQSVFEGDIDKIHIQRSEMDLQYANEFFSDYPSFIEKINDHGTHLKNIFSSDFTNRTYYKLMDQSGNGFHPVIFKPEWRESV